MGLSENIKYNETAVIYASGLTGFYNFDGWGEKHIWLTRFQRAGYRAHDTNLSDGFSALETGLDLVLPWHFSWLDRPMFVSVYGMQYWYYLDLAFNPDTADPTYETNAQELGFTVGFEKPWDMGFFDLDRLGLGIRRTNGLHVVRLVFNFPLE